MNFAPKHSPWGQVDHCQKMAEGIYWASTPSHGGLMMGAGLARQVLTRAAYNRGESFGSWECYEEDCAYAVPFWEFSDVILLPLYNFPGAEPKTYPQIRADLYKVLSAWEPDYLLEVGVRPDAELYAQYLERRAWIR